MNASFNLFTSMLLATTVLGCGLLKSHPGVQVIPITSFDTISGEWQGVSKTVPEMRDDASVLLVIREQGSFHFVSNRGTELLLGAGTLTLRDGTLTGKSDHGTGAFTLHDKAGTPILVAEGVLSNGHHYYLEMTRVR